MSDRNERIQRGSRKISNKRHSSILENREIIIGSSWRVGREDLGRLSLVRLVWSQLLCRHDSCLPQGKAHAYFAGSTIRTKGKQADLWTYGPNAQFWGQGWAGCTEQWVRARNRGSCVSGLVHHRRPLVSLYLRRFTRDDPNFRPYRKTERERARERETERRLRGRGRRRGRGNTVQ